jgi:hypothetical protein
MAYIQRVNAVARRLSPSFPPHPLYKFGHGSPGAPAGCSETFTRYIEMAVELRTTPREVWALNIQQLDHLLRPLVTSWAPPTAHPVFVRESNDTVDLVVRSDEVEYFVDAVMELDPLDEFLDSVQRLGDPQDQVSTTE